MERKNSIACAVYERLIRSIRMRKTTPSAAAEPAHYQRRAQRSVPPLQPLRTLWRLTGSPATRRFAFSGAVFCAFGLAATSSMGGEIAVVTAPAIRTSTDAPRLQDGSTLVYDGLTGTQITYTPSTPHTYIGQAFSVANAGGPVQISSMLIGMVMIGAQSFANTSINVQLWDNWFVSSSAPTPNVFSVPLGINSFVTGPISSTSTSFTSIVFALNFVTPISLSGLSNHGLTVNWKSDAAGTGNFVDNTNLTPGLRFPGGAAISPGANPCPLSCWYRNTTGRTDFNFSDADARVFSGAADGGLAFSLAAISPVPELGSGALMLLGLAGIGAIGTLRRRHISLW